jgi:hypothetical protein
MRLHTRDIRALVKPSGKNAARLARLGPAAWTVPGLDEPLEVHQDAAAVRAELRDLAYLTQGKARPARQLHFKGSQPQLDFWASSARIQGFVGGIGSGKTYSGAVKCLFMPPKTDILVCAPTYVMLRDGAWRTFWDVCAPYVKKHNQQRFETILTNGTKITWRATLFPERLRGINAGAIWIDEAGYVNETAWKIIIGRLRRQPGVIWLTSTPKGKKHWMYDVLVGKPDKHTEMFHSPTRENSFLPDAYLDLTAKNYGGAYKAQELEGQFVDFGGTKFKREWFNIISDGGYPKHPSREVRFWDLAVTAEGRPGQKRREQRDATASVMGCFHDGILYLRWGIHMKEEWPTVRRRIVNTAVLERGVLVGGRRRVPAGDRLRRAQPADGQDSSLGHGRRRHVVRPAVVLGHQRRPDRAARRSRRIREAVPIDNIFGIPFIKKSNRPPDVGLDKEAILLFMLVNNSICISLLSSSVLKKSFVLSFVILLVFVLLFDNPLENIFIVS